MPSEAVSLDAQPAPFRLGRSLAILGLIRLACTPALWASPADLPKAQEAGPVTITGELDPDESLNISGLDGTGDFLMIVADEGDKVRLLKRQGERSYQATPSGVIDLEAGGEVDLEAVAWGKDFVYVVGSHSRTRKQVDDEKTVEENLVRIHTTGIEPTRDHVYRLELDDEGRLESTKEVTLRDVFANDLLLRPFQVIPSKENGIDIEGLAVDEENRLFVGFRGPVLRGGYLPVLVVDAGEKFKQKKLTYDTRFVNLDGRGVRGLESVRDGFLVLAGPVGDGTASYQLYFWDGESCIGGEDDPDALDHVRAVCEIPAPEGAKAEGVHLVAEDDDLYRFVIVYDSLPKGGATEFTCASTGRE